MPAPELTPQTPGAPLNDDAPSDALTQLTERSVAELAASLPVLDDDELTALAVLEREAKNRKGALQAIEAELLTRHPAVAAPAPAPVTTPRTPSARRYLTPDGWVVPEPSRKPGG